MLTTFSLGENFNALTGLFITNLGGIQKLGMVLTMGSVKCDLLGTETLAHKVR
jgi:hypothetical protein